MFAMKIASLLIAVTFLVIAPLHAEAPDPATLKDVVNIKLGDKAAVQFQVDGNKLSQPKVVANPDSKNPTVTFDFSDQGKILILSTKNSFSKTLNFRALMRFKGRSKYVETSIIPVRAGISSFESWTDPIDDLILFDFKLTDQK
jgi:hypothetical protein